MTLRALFFVSVLLLATACTAMSPGTEPAPATVDLDAYRDDVQPLMDVSCASLDCHGQTRRPLRIYSVDGLRAADGLRTTDPLDLQMLTNDELASNVASILAVDPYYMPSPENDIVVKKPLAVRAGGIHHVGGEIWSSTDDPAYACVRDWLGGATEADTVFTDECYLAITNAGGVPPAPPQPDAGIVPSPDGGVRPPTDGGPPPPPVDAGPPTGAPSWTMVYASVLRPHCGGCHSGFRGSGGWNMGFDQNSGYASLVGVTARYCTSHARVTPGDAAGSGLYMTLVGNTCGAIMPPRSHLAPDQVALVADWINAGAAND